jgi:hypothetical protein
LPEEKEEEKWFNDVSSLLFIEAPSNIKQDVACFESLKIRVSRIFILVFRF